jgi:hypothetical protein
MQFEVLSWDRYAATCLHVYQAHTRQSSMEGARCILPRCQEVAYVYSSLERTREDEEPCLQVRVIASLSKVKS